MANLSPEKEIIKAAKAGNLEKIQELLQTNPSLLDARDSDGSTLLHYAAWKGHADLAAYLLEAGADVNARNSNEHWGTTPLHAAAHANCSNIARLLLDHGAEKNALDLNGQTPLAHTSIHKAKASAKVLEEAGAS